MNLKEQLYVCTLARCRSITRAAEELFISPSALSIYISNLEKYLGTPLFDRSGKAFSLTPIGEEYVIRARQMLDLKEEFDHLVDQTLKNPRPVIRVGIQQRRAIHVLPGTLESFIREFPEVDVSFRDGTQNELIAMYQKGMVDFMISVFRDEFPDSECVEIAKEQVLVALPKAHPANALAYEVPGDPIFHLDMKCLDRETFIIPPVRQSLGKTASRIFEEAQIKPGRVWEISHFDIIMSMVEKGLGVGFNRLGYIKDMKEYQVNYYQIGRDSFCSPLLLVYRAGREFTDYESRLVELLVQNIQSRY